MRFLQELQRRNVIRVGIAYVVAAWVLLQVADLVLENINAPDWVIQAFMLFLVLGFVAAVVVAWAYELTPDGIKRDAEIKADAAITAQAGRKLDRIIIGFLVVAVAYFVWESRFSERATDTRQDIAQESSETDGDPAPAAAGAADSPATEAAEQSVAVLPFVNMSPDPEQEYFSDGITEEIINAVVKIPGIQVPARTSVFGFKGHQGDIRAIGTELGVAHILEGSIRSQGEQVRITAQLIRVDNGFHLWSETFDRRLENIFAVQEEIAAAIASVLVGELGMEVKAVPNQTLNMQAYDVYLQGRALFRNRDLRASEVLRKATIADPDFAPAWAALAMAYQIDGYLLNDIDSQQRAISTARHALSLDPVNVDALNAMASALRDTWQWAEAERYFDAALALDPQSAELLEDYAEFLCNVGRWDEYLAVAERGNAIDPLLRPLADAYLVALAIHGRYQEALEIVDRLKGDSGWFGSTWALQTNLAMGDKEAVIKLIENTHPTYIAPELSAAMISLLDDPRDVQARELLRGIYSPGAQLRYHGAYEAALNILANSGDEEYVIDTLVAQFRRAGWANPEEIWQASMAPVRRHPRFQEVIEVLQLPAYWDEVGWPSSCARDGNNRIVCT